MKTLFSKTTLYIPALIGLFTGLFFVTFEMLGFNLAFLPGDLGDTRFNIYILEHAHQYFLMDNVPTEGYWNAPFIYPQESIITFSDNLLGTFFIYSFFRFIGFDIYLSFQWWMIVITILNYGFAYIFLNYVLKNKYASVLGAFIFAFSIALIQQYVHPQTYPRFCIPLAFYFAARFNNHLRTKDFFWMVFFVVYQFYCVVYLGFMLAIPLAIFSIVSLSLNWKKFVLKSNLKNILLLFVSLIVNVLILLPLVLPYMSSPAKYRPNGEVFYRKYEEILGSIPTIQSYLFINSETLLWGSLKGMGAGLDDWWNHQLFIGVTCIASMFFLLLFGLKRIIAKDFFPKIYWAFGISFLLTLLFYMRFEESSLYSYLFEIPGFNAVRALHRIINVELIFFGFFVALTFKIVLGNRKNNWLAFLIVLTFVVADNFIFNTGFVRFNKNEARERVGHIREQVKDLNFGTLVSYEPILLQGKKPFIHIDAMMVAQEFGLRLVNGYTSTVPTGYYHFASGMNERGRNIWMQRKGLEEEAFVIKEILTPEIEKIIQKIKSSPEWFERIKKQAVKRKITLEENIIRNAIWVQTENKTKTAD